MFIKDRRQERQTVRESPEKTIELRSERGAPEVPGAAARPGYVIPARSPETTSHQRGAVLIAVGLATAARVLRNRRFAERVIAGLIVQAALVQIAREGLGRAVRGLIAWDNARLAELEEELRRKRMTGAPGTAALSAALISTRRPLRGVVLLMVSVAAAARTLRNLDFDKQVILGVIILVALAQVARKGLGIAVKDVITWDNARLADLERRLRAQREAKAGQPAAS